MGTRFIFLSLMIVVIAAAVVLWLFPQESQRIAIPALIFALLLLIVLWRRVVIPATAAKRGLELVAAQDFNNRLAKVGERNADKVVALFNTIIDKLRNERLRNLEQENFLHLLIEASPMGVIMLDFDDRISMVNPSMLRLLKIDEAGDVLGKTVEELPSDIAMAMSAIPSGQDAEIMRGDDRRYRCYHLWFIQTGFKREFYLLESLTEAVLKAERRAYEKVIRTISHEVNNTMGGMRSVLDLVLDTTDEEDLREVIESCSDRCDRMCSFISSYADVVRIPEPVKRQTDIAKELRRMLPFLREMAGESISIEYDGPENGVVLPIDMSLIQQVVINIVKNAVESIPGDGRINISVRTDRQKTQLEISNNGAPISEEVARSLFTPFFTTKKDGKGLGLTLIADILNKHGATFRLFTDATSLTRFRILFT